MGCSSSNLWFMTDRIAKYQRQIAELVDLKAKKAKLEEKLKCQPKLTIVFRKEWFNFLEDGCDIGEDWKFHATNGIKIYGSDWTRFESNKDTLYIDSSHCNESWCPHTGYSDNEYIQFVLKYDRIVAALKEIETAYTASLTPKPQPMASTELVPVPDKVKTFLDKMATLGYNRKDAITALVKVNGDVVKAIEYLLGSE